MLYTCACKICSVSKLLLKPPPAQNAMEEEDVYRLTDDEYSTVCELAKSGKTKELTKFLSRTLNHSNRKIGPATFAPDPKNLNHVVRRLSPLSYSAMGGNIDTVNLFLSTYRRAVTVNPGAERHKVDPLADKEVRHDHPLYWACLNGHLDVAKALVEAKADVNLSNCMLATPLHAAATFGRIQMIDYLLKKGAKVNAMDIFNATPLIHAVRSGHLKTVEFLISRKADASVVTIEGYTIMHVAALNGHHEIVAQLLRRGIDPMFAPPPLQHCVEDNYIPCPLFLAAACGHHEVHNIMVTRCKCPYEVESDSLMLLSVGLRPFLYYCVNRKDLHIQGVKLPKKGTSEHERMDDREILNKCWLAGVAIRKEHNLLPSLQDLFKPTPPNPGDVGSYYLWKYFDWDFKCLQRGLGIGHPIIAGILFDASSSSLKDWGHSFRFKLLRDIIENWVREMEEKSFYRDPTHVQMLVENMFNRIFHWFMGTVKPYREQAIKYVEVSIQLLDTLMKLRLRHICEADSLQSILSLLLYMMGAWVLVEYLPNIDAKPLDDFVTPEKCEQIGKDFVAKHLNSLEGTTLLHIALNDCRLVRTVTSRSTIFYNQYGAQGVGYAYRSPPSSFSREIHPGLLVRALLRWGADGALDVFDWNGQRPLHLAVLLTDLQVSHTNTDPDVIAPLVAAGAHLDYTNKQGKTPLDLCTSIATQELLAPKGPRALTCLSCVKIIEEKIEYEDLPIPHRIKKLIRYHQGKS